MEFGNFPSQRQPPGSFFGLTSQLLIERIAESIQDVIRSKPLTIGNQLPSERDWRNIFNDVAAHNSKSAKKAMLEHMRIARTTLWRAVNLDTRGSTAGDPAIYPVNPNTSKAYGENVVSGNNTVFVHFHSEFGTVFLDDVVVETDGGTNPTSTPIPTATATQVVNSTGMTWFLYQ